jgi:hypothetical protein
MPDMPEKASASLRKDAIHPQAKSLGFSGMAYNKNLLFRSGEKGSDYPTSSLLAFFYERAGRKDRMSPRPMAAAQRHPQNATL